MTRLALALGKTREAEIGAVLEEIKIEIDGSGHAFQLIEQVNGWHFVTSGACAPWVRQLFPESKPIRLSGPALETLAIIAYRQPITRADIEAVRGVAVDGMVNMLLERGLIRIAAARNVPGRPLLYESTEYFLQHFGLKTLDELPNSAEFRRIPLPVAQVEVGPEPVAERGENPHGPMIGSSRGPWLQGPPESARVPESLAPTEPAP